MLRVRFEANPDDFRPVHWPIEYPYWCSGYGENYSIIVAYADSLEYILKNWPEAENIDIMQSDCKIEFTDRFPKPEWWKEGQTE